MEIPIRHIPGAPTISLEPDPKVGKLSFGLLLNRAAEILDAETRVELIVRVMEQAANMYGALLILHEYVNVPADSGPIEVIDDLMAGKRELGYGS